MLCPDCDKPMPPLHAVGEEYFTHCGHLYSLVDGKYLKIEPKSLD